MKVNAVFCILIFITFAVLTKAQQSNPWRWRCNNDKKDGFICVKERFNKCNSTGQMSETTCALTCGEYGSLMPRPQKASIGNSVNYFCPSRIFHKLKVKNGIITSRLNNAVQLLTDNLHNYHPNAHSRGNLWQSPKHEACANNTLIVRIVVPGNEEILEIGTNESYTLEVTTVQGNTTATINAPNYFGARHALETLSQLIDYDEERNALQIVAEVSIKDEPVFTYRGISLDTSRNFIPISNIKRVLDGMSYNKLNSFHWHITDTQSFPMHLLHLPNMTLFGAYNSKAVYNPNEIKHVVEYALQRGIRVVPEFDAPAHVGHGWQWGEEAGLGPLVVCLDGQPWQSYCVGPPCGQLNLANPNIYVILEKLYKEMLEIFGNVDLFHYGGDEIHLNCWNSSDIVHNWMLSNNFGVSADSYYQQWSVFQENVQKLVTEAAKEQGKLEPKGVIWTSHLTEVGHVDKYLNNSQYIIQIWTTGKDAIIAELLKKGYQVIMSNYDAFYFDCGVGSWVAAGNNWCSPYKGWQTVFDNDIMKIAHDLTGSTAYDNQVIGGEGALWTEQVDHSTLDAKLWPRGSALAERLWTSPSGNYRTAENRILQHRQRLLKRGLMAERLQPEYCKINQHQCRA